MPDWTRELHARLAELRISPAREAEIVEELSQHLNDRYEELRAAGSSDADARRLAIEELNEAGGLARRMQTLSQSHTQSARRRWTTGRRSAARLLAGRAIRPAHGEKGTGLRAHDRPDARRWASPSTPRCSPSSTLPCCVLSRSTMRSGSSGSA